MTALDQLRLLANYNAWMNQRIYDAAARLSPEAFLADRGAFFGSLCGTLNHHVVSDTIWLKRFATHPAQHAALDALRTEAQPATLSAVLHTDLAVLRAHRESLDATISAWLGELSEADLDHPLAYRNTKGVPACRRLGALLQHFFNHQTHHRGQATTLLTQAGEDVGLTDLLAVIPNEIEEASV
jgi:uncharacterized damage-inducible protein DinB